MEKIPSPFEQLIGEELSAVVFVRDYIQLEFNPPPRLNITAPIVLDLKNGHISQNEPAFANAIIGQIGKFVNNMVFSPGDYLKIVFADNSSISISLKPEDSAGGESVLISGKNQLWSVL